MKTLMIASGLMLATSVAAASSWEETWQNPDLGAGVYDKPVTLTEPRVSSRDFVVSLDTFNQENPDISTRYRGDRLPPDSSAGFASSLDNINQDNPDHI